MNLEKQEVDIKAKFLLLGDGAVGKTSIRRKFFDKSFNPGHLMTIGASFAKKTIEVDNETKLEAQIWDLAGQPNFQQVTQRFMIGVHGAIVVFDLTRKETLRSVPSWIDRMYRLNQQNLNIPFILVGNKADLHKDRVAEKKMQTFYQYFLATYPPAKNCVGYLETSAKTGLNVDDTFQTLARKIIKNSRK